MEKVVICIVLSLVSVGLGFYSSQISSGFSPVSKIGNFFIYAILFLTLATQLATIYLVASKSPFLAALLMMPFLFYWYMFAPFHPNSDAAGNGMARAFHDFFGIVIALVGGVVFYLITKFLVPGGLIIGLVVAALTGLCGIMSNASSYQSGDDFDREARWHKMSVDDYRKTLLRSGMVENNDSWRPQDLDADPGELDHWDVHGTKQISVKTIGGYPCLFIEGHYIFPSRRVDLETTSLCDGYHASEDNGDANHRTSFMPDYVFMVWYDCVERKTIRFVLNCLKNLVITSTIPMRFGSMMWNFAYCRKVNC